MDWEKQKTPLRTLLERQDRGGAAADRALARDMAFGVLQRLNTLDWALSPIVSQPFGSLDPSVRAALRLGAWQILFAADRFPAYAAVNETVPLAGSKAKSLVNAVLRNLQRRGRPPEVPDLNERLSLEHSHPLWLVRRWTARWGKEAEGVLASGNAPPPFSLRVNGARISREALLERLRGEGHEAEPSSLSPDGLRVSRFFSLNESPSFREGMFSVQDEGAQLAVLALDPKPGETVLDLCSGVGGKTAHLSERMEGHGRLVAVDADARRLETSKKNGERLGTGKIESLTGDVRTVSLPKADRVLVDAPCSGLGTLRRRPDIKWAREESDLARLAVLQKEILEGSAKAVKPGGVLVYATCSMEPEENEEVIGNFLGNNPSFVPERPPVREDVVGPDRFVRLRPDQHGCDGFFIARLRKSDDSSPVHGGGGPDGPGEGVS